MYWSLTSQDATKRDNRLAGGYPADGAGTLVSASMPVRDNFTFLQLVHRPAIRALALAMLRHIDVHARMAVP